MTLTIERAKTAETDAKPVTPTSVASAWMVMVPAGQVTTADASGVLNEPSTLTRDRTVKKREYGLGTFFVPRLRYNSGLSGITDPVVRVYGRYDNNDSWIRLANRSGNYEVTLATAGTDLIDGGFQVTDCGGDDFQFDLIGSNQVLVLVSTALAATGTTASATIEGRLI